MKGDASGPARVRASVAADVIGVRGGVSDATIAVKRNRQDLLIPGRYVPARVLKLWKVKELTPVMVKTAAMFCFNEHHLWITRTIGTNFPRGYKVQTSVRTYDAKLGSVERKPPCYDTLVWLLVDEVPFREVALRCGFIGARRTLHREGKQILRRSLEECRRFWAS